MSGVESGDDPGDVPVLPPVESSVRTVVGLGPDAPHAEFRASHPPSFREERISEPPPPAPAPAPNPKMLLIVFGVVGLLAFVGIIGGIVFVVRRASGPPKDEPTVTKYSVPESSVSTASSSSASEAPATPASAVPAPSALSKGFGWLTLTGPPGKVIVKGKPWGESGQKLAVPCGHVWVGIGNVNEKGKVDKTLTKPQSIFVKCGGETEATAKPKK